MLPSQQPRFTNEDCNLPSEERLSLLERLEASLGDVPPHFWAACHLCDLQKLALLVQTAELNPNIVCITAGQTYTMVGNCKLNTIGVFLQHVANISQGINLSQAQLQLQQHHGHHQSFKDYDHHCQDLLHPLYKDRHKTQIPRQPKGKKPLLLAPNQHATV
jgi:hypothetical protein